MQEYKELWQRYFDFSGRTTVRGFWMAMLINVVVSLILGFVDRLLGITLLSTIYSLAILIPGLAIEVRRLRDAGKHWGWLFISLVPLAGIIILIVMLCKPSVPAETTPEL